MADWNPRANEIFLKALDLAPVQRRAFLDQACPDDPGLRAQVEALLAASARAGSFLEEPAVEQLATQDEPPAPAQPAQPGRCPAGRWKRSDPDPARGSASRSGGRTTTPCRAGWTPGTSGAAT